MNSRCDVCYNSQDAPSNVPHDGMGVFSRGMGDFEKCARNGCTRCNFIHQALLHFDVDQVQDENIVIIYRNGHCELMIPPDCATVQLYTPIGHTPAWAGIASGIELSSTADSHSAFEFISACLVECNESHLSCQIAEPQLPTRLIDVGSPLSPDVSLIETSSLPYSPYVALSYCWGAGKNLKTITSNIQDMKQGIRVSDMPQTLQDAITVTRRLEQRLLWVDALCIIQDSLTDWELESARMAAVYRNAYLTISAGTAEDVTEGFLSHKHLAGNHKPHFTMDWRNDCGFQTILGARIVPSGESHSSTDELVMPLALRGWTLQEGLLSTRVLAFTEHELWWSCLFHRRCECGTMDAFPVDNIYSITRTEDAFKKWREIVSEFTTRSLTNLDDKLPALAGMAKVVQDITRSAYVAGLWMDNLVKDLVWQAPNFGPLHQLPNRPSKYQGPSFSWVSVDACSNFDAGYFTSVGTKRPHPPGVWESASVALAAGSSVIGQNPLGRVEDGFVTLRGPLGKTTLEISVRRGDRAKVYAIQGGNFYPDTRLEEFQYGGKNGCIEKSVCRSPYGSHAKVVESGTAVYILHVGEWRSDRAGRREIYLVLGKSPRDLGKYERLGIYDREINLLNEGTTDPTKGAFGLREITLL